MFLIFVWLCTLGVALTNFALTSWVHDSKGFPIDEVGSVMAVMSIGCFLVSLPMVRAASARSRGGGDGGVTPAARSARRLPESSVSGHAPPTFSLVALPDRTPPLCIPPLSPSSSRVPAPRRATSST
jgi:hypothetical protein